MDLTKLFLCKIFEKITGRAFFHKFVMFFGERSIRKLKYSNIEISEVEKTWRKLFRNAEVNTKTN